MNTDSPERFDTLSANYAKSEVHSSSPTLERLPALLPHIQSVCDVASGAGHTGLKFAGIASKIVAVDAAPHMLSCMRDLARARGVNVETVEAFEESIPLPDGSFDLVTCRLAAHHFSNVAAALGEMARLAKPGGRIAIIDLEGNADPGIDALSHDIEVLHDPTHVRSHTAAKWRELFAASGLALETCETRCREIPSGLTISRWCEVGNSGEDALKAIRARLASAPSEWLAELEITRDADGEFRIPVRTLLIIGRKPFLAPK